MARGNRGIRITPQQWMTQWVAIDHVFNLNIWNFSVKAGQTATEVFKKSFDLKRFNSKGSVRWKPGRGTNKGGYAVGSLFESGSLKNSIKYNVTPSGPNGKKIKVFTDPAAFGGTYSHPGFCFADVHNSSDSSIRTKRVSGMPQRQFMPTTSDSTVMSDKLKLLQKMIFQSFPGVRR